MRGSQAADAMRGRCGSGCPAVAPCACGGRCSLRKRGGAAVAERHRATGEGVTIYCGGPCPRSRAPIGSSARRKASGGERGPPGSPEDRRGSGVGKRAQRPPEPDAGQDGFNIIQRASIARVTSPCPPPSRGPIEHQANARVDAFPRSNSQPGAAVLWRSPEAIELNVFHVEIITPEDEQIIDPQVEQPDLHGQPYAAQELAFAGEDAPHRLLSSPRR